MKRSILQVLIGVVCGALFAAGAIWVGVNVERARARAELRRVVAVMQARCAI